MSAELRLACQRIIESGALPPLRLAAPPATVVAAQRIQGSEHAFQGFSRVDLDAMAGGIAASIASGRKLTRRQVRDACWCLWDTTPALARDDAALSALCSAWESSDRPRVFKSLAASFMKSYGRDQAARQRVAGLLTSLAARWGGAWGELHRRYAIFDLERGPAELAREVIRLDRSPVDILRQAGIGEVSSAAGLAEEVVRALLSELAGNPDHELRLARVQRFALRPDGRVAFPGQGAPVVEALVRPFVGQAADTDLQDRFLAVIVKAFGDPRLQPGSWHDLPHRELILGWLTRQSLRQFLDVVDAISIGPDAKRMWRYRRAFWEGVYDFLRRQNVSVQAWVAFGPDGARRARQVFKEASFATLETEGKPVSPDHAVLLFQVGGCVIADWNHNGKCNIWSDADARSAPRLFKKPMRYGSDEVRIDSGQGNLETRDLFSIMHMSAETYSWQNKVARRLLDATGIRIPQSAYRLR